MNQKIRVRANLQHDVVIMRRDIASTIINLATEEVEDIQTGIEDRTYSASENRDIDAKKGATECAEVLYRESGGDVLALPRAMAARLIDMARNRVNDIESGLADGTYETAQNADFYTKRAAVEEAEHQYGRVPETSFGSSVTSLNKTSNLACEARS